MMENRSFDHMLGFLASPEYPVEGLTGTELNLDFNSNPVTVSPDAAYSGDLTTDPGHHVPDVNEQLFGNREVVDLDPAPMSGFVKNYERLTNSATKGHNIMKCFGPDRLPALQTLAQQYVVCDNWFSSVPGPTLPNRSYIHAATSMGRVDMSPNWLDEAPTIYELLDRFNVTSRIYYHDMTMAMTFKTFVMGKQNKWFGMFDDFERACKKNTLPTYSFIEPRFNASEDGGFFAAADQHPDHDVREGERLIRDVYEAIWKNEKVRNSTLLVITYDEHGGLYDHIPPPATVNPDGKVWKGSRESPDPPFAFTRLGVRVPTVLISPFVEAGTIDTTLYDHTSVIATARALFLADPATNFLTQRDKNANSFESLLTLDQPRADMVDFGAKSALERPALSFAAMQAELDAPISGHTQAMIQHAHDLERIRLVPEKRSSIDPHSIETERQAAAYLNDVMARLRSGGRRVRTAGGGQ
jgi:phospholipase C